MTSFHRIADSGYSRLTPLVGAEQVHSGCWGEYVASPVHDCVRRACRLVVRRSPHAHAHAAAPDVDDSAAAAAAAAATAASSPAEERKCGDGVDSACEESPAAGAGSPHAYVGHAPAAPAPAATAVTDDDVVDSDDGTGTSSVAADCVTESSAVTYVEETGVSLGSGASTLARVGAGGTDPSKSWLGPQI